MILECDLETHGFDTARLGGQPQRRPGVARRLPRPHRAHRRAGQEPPQHRDVVARQRVRHRREPGRHGRVGARPRPVAPRPLRGRLHRRRTRTSTPACTPPIPETEPIGTRRLPRAAARLHAGAGRPAAHQAVPPVRVRARHGQRPRRARPVRGARATSIRGCTAVSSGSGATTASARRHRRRRRVLRATAATSARSCTTATS